MEGAVCIRSPRFVRRLRQAVIKNGFTIPIRDAYLASFRVKVL